MFKSSQSAPAKALQVLPLLLLLVIAGCGSREQRAQGYYERGVALLEKGDLIKARIELRNALQNKEDMVAAWRAIVTLEDRAQNTPLLTTALRRVVELDPNDFEARVRLGKLLFAAGGVAEALKVIDGPEDKSEAFKNEAAKNVGALALRAAILLRLNDAKGAIQEAHKVLGLDPSNVDAMIVLAAEKFSRQDFKGALEITKDIPAARQDDLPVLFMKIRIYEKLGDLAQIEAILIKLKQNNPKETAFARELVKFYVATKRVADAEKEMRALVAANPTDEKIGMEMVAFAQATKGPAAAREELGERIKAGGKVLFYQLALAQLEVAQGDYAEGVKSLERLIADSKDAADIAAARTSLAEIHLARKNVSAAEAVIADILRADGRSVNGLRLRATTRIETGQLEGAINDLRQALNDQPRSPQLLSLLALAFERNGSIDLADKQLADAMRASNFAPLYGLNYVAFLQRRGITKHAEDVLTDLVSRNPGNTQVLAALARMKLERQDWVGAQEIADVIRRIGTQTSIADQINAASLVGQKKYDESLNLLQNAYDANPNAVQPLFALVRTYIEAKQYDKAQSFLDSVLKANPNNAEAYVMMGLTQLAKNTPDVAVQSFKTAIEKQPKSPLGYAALANYYVQRANFGEAEKALQAGLREQPGAVGLRQTLASIYEAKGDFDAAITEYETILKEQPGSMVVANNLASLLTDRRGDQASLERAATVAAVLAKSQLPQFKDTLGWIYLRKGDHKSALPLLEEAATGLPNNGWVRYHLAMALVAAGNQVRAAEEFAKAAQLGEKDTTLKEKIAAAQKGK